MEKSSVAPAVPAAVIYKLLGFTLAMVAGPITTYYLTLNTVFRGSSTWAGATAAIMANVVLVAYVIVAMKEDQSDRLAAEEKARKGE
ncbi:vacuolar ATPase assembly integral membrane protein vma21 [Xylographa trunciseda]|nr:vacuolar ATPase assembly integral membrane protein vma21 [Xylographa trunciseda]